MKEGMYYKQGNSIVVYDPVTGRGHKQQVHKRQTEFRICTFQQTIAGKVIII